MVSAITILAMFFGGALGSGLYCLVKRKQAGLPWAGKTRSCCDNCGHALTAIDLVPVLSYIWLGGKCRHCKEPIPRNSFRVELTFALAFSATACGFAQDIVLGICCGIAAILSSVGILYSETRQEERGKANGAGNKSEGH